MKGTRLWQSTGSPLIGGRSRRLRPFWQPWLLGSALAAGAIVGWLVVVGPHTVAFLVASILAAGVLAGAALGVWVARQAGWDASWLLGAATGAILSCAMLAITTLPIFSVASKGGS